VGTLPGQVCGDTLDLRRRNGMRRVGAWEMVSLDGVMDRQEEALEAIIEPRPLCVLYV
jgi:hypothetical protein